VHAAGGFIPAAIPAIASIPIAAAAAVAIGAFKRIPTIPYCCPFARWWISLTPPSVSAGRQKSPFCG
jgi:hypothetical protein